MKQDFRAAMDEALTGKTGFLGIGNTDLGDDGFGVRLAEALAASGVRMFSLPVPFRKTTLLPDQWQVRQPGIYGCG